MGLLKSVQALLISLLLLTVTVRAQDSPPAPEDPLPTTLSTEVVDTSKIISVEFPKAISSKLRFAKRQDVSGKYILNYSQTSIATTGGDVIFGIPVQASSMRAALQQAIETAATFTPTDLTNIFVSSAAGLTVVMKSTAKNPDASSFNWQDYSSVASILLAETPTTDGIVNSFVGVVVGPDGIRFVDVAVVPQFVIDRGNTGAISTTPPPPPATGNEPKNDNLPRRLHKRVQVAVPGTAYRIHYSVGTARVAGTLLLTLTRYAGNMVVMNFNPFEALNTVITDGTQEIITEAARGLAEGATVFRITTLPGIFIDGGEMVYIMRVISGIVRSYVGQNDQDRSLRTLRGYITTAASEAAIAYWSVGEAFQHFDGNPARCTAYGDTAPSGGCLGFRF